MTLNAERLTRAKKDIADIIVAIKAGNDSNLSQESRLLFRDLMGLDDTSWDPLLASLADSELRDQLRSLRQYAVKLKATLPDGAFSQIRHVGHMPFFDVSRRSLMIRLHLDQGNQSLVSSQDIEDTLWIGAAVLVTVSDAMQGMESTLVPDVRRDCIGEHFENNLKTAEDAIKKIKRIFTAVRETDAPDGAG